MFRDEAMYMSTNYVCEEKMCSGCMACLSICPKNAISIKDGIKYFNAEINQARCISCGACHAICQMNHKPKAVRPFSWYQGWHQDNVDRATSSSGGAVAALTEAFIDEGGVVYSCVFRNGEFKYICAHDKETIKQFKGSKYVKSNPIGIYESIKESLIERDVLFIGLPCHVAAVNNYLSTKEYNHTIYTCDLICHGTPSSKLLDIFLKQYDIQLDQLDDIKFRNKGIFNIQCDGAYILHKSVRDAYTLSFLKGLCYTDNCYKCQYAKIERVSDITVGDSWGTQIDEEERAKGISLILCQTVKGEQLLKKTNMELKEVNLEKAIDSNHQLREPSADTEEHKRFFDLIQKGKSFNHSVFVCYPKTSIKQYIKLCLIKLKFYGS